MTLRVSIALCTYNGAKYLAEQLESLQRQTCVPYEIVIGDDGSSDETLAILDAFEPALTNVVRLTGRAGGPTQNFERTMAACTGDIIMPCDQDDIWHPTKIERVMHAFEPGVSLVFCDATLVDEHRSSLGRTLWQSIGFEPADQQVMMSGDPIDALVRRTIAFGLTMAYRRDVHRCAHPIPMPFGHDNFTALIAAGMGQVRLVPKPLLDYRQHANQVSSAGKGLRDRLNPSNSAIVPTSTSFAKCYQRLDTIPQSARAKGFASLRRAVYEKAHHLHRRETLPLNPFSRSIVVAGESLQGRYTHYSNGWKSALRDLVLGAR